MSPEAAKLYKVLSKGPPPWLLRAMPIWAARLLTDAAATAASRPSPIIESQIVVGGRRVQRLEPPRAGEGLILYLHGGGYTTGSIKSHRRLAGHVALASRRVVLLLDYRLAPENPYPAALQDALEVLAWALRVSSSVALCGDSAGGGLALSVAQAAGRTGSNRVACVGVMSPMTDLTFSAASWTSRADRDILLDRQALQRHASEYLGSEPAHSPSVSPLFGTFAAFPPTLIQVGSDEQLLDDSVRLASRLEQAGRDVQLDIVPAMQHVFQMFAGKTPEATDAITRMGEFFDRCLDRRR